MPNCSGNVLDLALATSAIDICTADEPLSRVDDYHKPLIVSFHLQVKRADFFEQPWFCYPQGDYYSLYRYLKEFDWSIVLGDTCVESCTNKLTETLKQVLDAYISPKNSRKTKYPPWFSKSLRQCLRRKLHYHRLFKKTRLQKWYGMFSPGSLHV